MRYCLTCLVLLIGALFGQVAAASPLPVQLTGTDFHGGAADLFGSIHDGVQRVNFVYAQSTGDRATMQAGFTLDAPPDKPLFLILQGRDDDGPTPCPLDILVNGTLLQRGDSGFAKDHFETRRYAIPAGIVHTDMNTITIRNTAPEGVLGQPPWFMVAACAVADSDYHPPAVGDAPIPEIPLRIPDKLDSFLERAARGESPSGFKIRGTKGWNWTPEQYLEEVPVLARFRMNFLMTDYASLFSRPTGTPVGSRNEWWLPLPEEAKRAYEKVIRACKDAGVIFCFAMHPQLDSPRPLDPTSDDDFEKFWAHYAWAQSVGATWFAVSLDDISGVKIDGEEHARLVNRLLLRLRLKDPAARMIFCPTYYSGDGSDPQARAYLDALARTLLPDVYVFWTGPTAVPTRITRAEAEGYSGAVKHRLILWDNYPVNDGSSTLHLGPITGRDQDLCAIVDGYMSNPLYPQHQINEIPLFTLADFAYAPARYDPAASIGQAIVHASADPAAREVLRDLVALFPGRIGSTGDNPPLDQYRRIVSAPDSQYLADLLIAHVEAVLARLDRVFPHRYRETKATLHRTAETMRSLYRKQYGEAAADNDRHSLLPLSAP